jgi:small subunit ribosomal protein S7
MPRRYKPNKSLYNMDPRYKSVLVHIIVNRLISSGKKSLSYRLLYLALYQIKEKTQGEPLAILERALYLITPTVKLKACRVGGRTYQIPCEVVPRQGTAIAIQWLLTAARTQVGFNISRCLSREIINAARESGAAVRKRDEVHRIAKANKIFARFRFGKSR